jgi:hypothetical protein
MVVISVRYPSRRAFRLTEAGMDPPREPVFNAGWSSQDLEDENASHVAREQPEDEYAFV